jgi:hypothetical protein
MVIRSGGREVGSESFRITSGDAGVRITVKSVYPGARPPVELSASLDRTVQTNELAFQLEHRGGTGGSQIFAVQQRNRLTIRRVERGVEQASEAPGGANVVLLADSIFALYLQLLPLATETGRPLTAVLPQGERRLSFTAQRIASAETGGTRIKLSGGIEGEIALGNRGEVLRITLPGLGLEALRKQD